MSVPPSSLIAFNFHLHTETIHNHYNTYSPDAVRVAVVNQGGDSSQPYAEPQQPVSSPQSISPPSIFSSLSLPSSEGERSVALLSGSAANGVNSLIPSSVSQTPVQLIITCLPQIVAGLYAVVQSFSNPNTQNVQENAKKIKEDMEKVVNFLKDVESTGRHVNTAFSSIGSVARAILFNG